MRSVVLTSVLVAAWSSSVAADSCNGVGQSQDSNGNWYCSAVTGMSFQGVQGSGTYPRVTNFDMDTGTCTQATQDYSGNLGPLSEEVRAT